MLVQPSDEGLDMLVTSPAPSGRRLARTQPTGRGPGLMIAAGLIFRTTPVSQHIPLDQEGGESGEDVPSAARSRKSQGPVEELRVGTGAVMSEETLQGASVGLPQRQIREVQPDNEMSTGSRVGVERTVLVAVSLQAGGECCD